MMTIPESPTPATGERVNILGIDIDAVTFDEVIARADAAIRSRDPLFICTANVDHLMRLQRDEEFRAIYRDAELVTADGMPLLWAARRLGHRLPGRVTGADLAPALCDLAGRDGRSLFLLGGQPGVAEQARDRIRDRRPGIGEIGVWSPPYGFERDESELAAIDDRIRASAPDILLIALGAPKQEKWYGTRGRALGVPVAIGCGAAVDFLAGHIARAPEWTQRAGLEWLYRLSREPRRLARRYLVEDTPFFRMVWRQRRLQRRGQPWTFDGGGQGS